MVSPVAWTLREGCTVQPLCRSIRFIGAGDCATASARRNENRESTRLIRVIRTLLMSFQALKAVLLYRLRLLHLVFVQTSGAAAMVGTRVSRCATHAQDPPHIAPIDGKEYADKRGLRAKLAEKGSKATGGDAKAARACTHKSPGRVSFRANRTLSRHRRMTESDPQADVPLYRVPRIQLPPRRPRRHDEYDIMRHSQKQTVSSDKQRAGNQGERTSVGPEPIRRTFQ